jgi:hypothetical protein
MSASATQSRVIGDVATQVIFENEKVRIWEMRLAPGEKGPVHRHDLDYILVLLEGDKIRSISEPDTRGPYPGITEANVVPGMTIYVEKGGVETAENHGKKPYREILIELKES